MSDTEDAPELFYYCEKQQNKICREKGNESQECKDKKKYCANVLIEENRRGREAFNEISHFVKSDGIDSYGNHVRPVYKTVKELQEMEKNETEQNTADKNKIRRKFVPGTTPGSGTDKNNGGKRRSKKKSSKRKSKRKSSKKGRKSRRKRRTRK